MLLNRSRGELGGKPFAQHCSCPACFRCSIGSTVAAFSGTIFVWEVCLNRTGTSPALNRQGGNVLVAALYCVVFLLPKWMCLLHRSLWSRVLALPPLREPMIFQLQSQTCHKLVPATRTLDIEQDCSFRISLQKKKMPRCSPSDKLIRPGEKFIFQCSAQTAFKSLRLLRRRLDLKSSLRSETSSSQPSLRDGTMIFITSGGARAAV